MYFAINDIDFSGYVAEMRVGYETLVSDSSGRNANGDTVIDIVNRKTKIYITFRHTTQAEMQNLLSAIADYVVRVSFLNPNSGEVSHITAYTGTPEPDYYTISNKTVYKPMSLNFIEL